MFGKTRLFGLRANCWGPFPHKEELSWASFLVQKHIIFIITHYL